MDSFFDTGRQHFTGSRIHGSDVAVQIALYDTHRRGLDEQVEEGILLFKFEVFAAQAVQQVVEGADDDVCLVLTRWCKACGKVQFAYQFDAPNQRVVGADGLAIEIPKVDQQHDDETLGHVEHRGVASERSEKSRTS